MKFRIALCILILTFLIGSAGCGGTGGRVEISALLSDEAGNTYVAWRMVRSVGDHDIHLTKISPTGEVLWDKALFIGDNRRVTIMGLAGDNRGGVFVGWEVLTPENGKEGRHNFEKNTLVNVDGEANITMSQDFFVQGIQMASDSHGGVLLCRFAWENPGIERVDKQGNTLWEYQLEISKDYRQFIPGNNGESFILLRNKDDSYVTIHKIDSEGQAIWGREGVTIDIPPYDLYGEKNPLMSSDDVGGVIVSWEIWISDEMKSNMGAFRINANGELMYNETLRISTIPPSGHMKTFPDDSGGSIIIWEGIHPGGISLYAQKINDKGEPFWRKNGVAVCTDLPAYSPRFDAISDGQGGVIVVWRDGRSKLSAQRLDSSGQPQWGEEGIEIAQKVCDIPILISGDEQHGITIGWSAEKNEYSGDKSYVQMINSEGMLLWGTNGIEISNSSD